MPRKDRKRVGPQPEAVVSARNKRNSTTSPWRTRPALHSVRQRKCREYFDRLEERGDTRRIPRPELD